MISHAAGEEQLIGCWGWERGWLGLESMGCLEGSPGLPLPSAPQAPSPSSPDGLVLFLVSAGSLLQGVFPVQHQSTCPSESKSNLGSLGSSWENSLSLSLISVLEKIGMLFTCFSKPWTGGLCFGLREGKTLERAAPFVPLSPSVFPPLLQPPQLWAPHSLPSSDSP